MRVFVDGRVFIVIEAVALFKEMALADQYVEFLTLVDLPVNVLALPGVPPVAELAEIGVKRVSVGGAFAFAALGALAEAGRELLEKGTYGLWDLAGPGSAAAAAAFTA